MINNFERFKSVKDDNFDIFSQASNKLNKLQIDSYCRVLKILQKSRLTVEFDLIPYGSVIQFLGKDDSDLDLYVSIETEDCNILCKNWLEINKAIKENYKETYYFNLSKRLCLIKFTDHNGVKIDLNYFGKCGVINSMLVRYYSLIDVRFSILVYNLKYILKELKISNADKIIYLNSYSWVFILITFLQDKIDPPVLPKLLDINMFEDINIKTFAKGNKIDYLDKNKLMLFKEICRRNLFKNETYSLYEIPLNYKEIYKKFNQDNNPNSSSVAVLFLNFIEFITMRFNPESMYFDTKLQKLRNKKEVTEENLKFYFMPNKKNQAKIFIRDAFDHTYNPAKDMFDDEHYNTFKQKLNNLYKNILENGIPFS